MSTESISGTVYDQNGKTVAGATVSATNKETSSVMATATSESNGAFLIIVPAGGTYQYTATKSGESDLKVKTQNDDKDSLSLGLGFTAVQASD